MNKKTVIIILVSAAVVLCCCVTASIVALVAMNSYVKTTPLPTVTPMTTSTPTVTTTFTPTATAACDPEEVGLTTAQFNQLLRAYQDPFVVHLRTALNNYLSGSNVGVSDLAIEGLGTDEDGYESGLVNFPRSYYSSKFLVYYVDNDPAGGGKNVTVLFKDRPDALFTAWIYDTSDGGYEMRGFWKEDFTSADIDDVLEEAGCLMQDTRFAL